jgi:hypothetical protein
MKRRDPWRGEDPGSVSEYNRIQTLSIGKKPIKCIVDGWIDSWIKFNKWRRIKND